MSQKFVDVSLVDPVTAGEEAANGVDDVFFYGPEGVGKSLALHTFLNASARVGKKRVLIHLMSYTDDVFKSPRLWKKLADEIYSQLMPLSPNLDPPPDIAEPDQLTSYMFQKVLPTVGPVVIGFDEIGRLRHEPLEVQFNWLLRVWQERELQNKKQLHIGLAGLERLQEFPKATYAASKTKPRFRDVKLGEHRPHKPDDE